LLCTIAQTDQFFDGYHRPGNVHGSNGAAEFMLNCFDKTRREFVGTLFELRMDSAFFNQAIISITDQNRVNSTASVPVERFVQLKEIMS
jgi:hypothetical protein